MTASMTTSVVRTAADRLRTAARTGVPCAPVRDLLGTDDVDLAYEVQRELTAARSADGRRVVGRKIGLTSPAVQQQLGVDQPDVGALFDDMACDPNVPIPVQRLLQPKIEAEIAFVLARDLDDPGTTPATAAFAVDHAVAALEIVDSRIANWDITITDTVADNASSGLFVLGREPRPLDSFVPREVTMTMWADDAVVSNGRGDACLGDPLAALAWLARTLVRAGDPLQRGDIVLSGALGPMVPVRAGTRVRAWLQPIGEVTATFTGEAA